MTAHTLEPVADRPQSLSDIAFDRIRNAIVQRSLEPGTRVSESMLGEMLQVSKTPVREALLRLCHVGLVEPTTRGLRVVLPNRDIIRDAYEVRTGLESVAAKLAAERADDPQRLVIVEAARKSLESARKGDPEAFAEWDMSFHTSVAEAAGNKLLTKAVGDSIVLAFTLRSRDVLTSDDSVHCGRQHVALAKAIKAGEAEQAAQQMFTHITEVAKFVLAAAG
ncbi:MAG TPA: GntR family transcriptional regulator [Pseudonocardiaceae bacterium]|jgi:DNA-binding GntR family transcriptional regulator|nr:GntR family transcriptional regulator [Pseudonocardiaceae bacterium]